MGTTDSRELGAGLRVLRFRGDHASAPDVDFLYKLEPALVVQVEKELKRLTDSRACFLRPNQSCAHDFCFSLQDPDDRNAVLAACELDLRITKVKPSLVPSKLSETEFFTNYFTHVAELRKWLFAAAGASALPRSTRITLLDSGESYETQSMMLMGRAFENKMAFARFINTHNPKDLTAPQSNTVPVVKSSWSADEMAARKKALMELIRFGEPTLLSATLEESNRLNLLLTDRFWCEFERKVLLLSRQTKTFVIADLADGHEVFSAMYDALATFDFNPKRDLRAHQAAWDVDPYLTTAFRVLIPAHLSKSAFWNNYFHNVGRVLCEELSLLYSTCS